MKRIFFIFLFFFAVNALSQEMKLQEEIVGKDLSIKKTEIFPHSIPEVKLQLPSPPLLKIEEGEEKKNRFEIDIGNYPFFNISLMRTCGKYLINFGSEFSKGYRKNDSFIQQTLSLKYKEEDTSLSLNFLNRDMELPGPVFSPFTESRNSHSLNVSFEHREDPFEFGISEIYHSVQDMNANFLKFIFSFEKSGIENKNVLERYDFTNEFSQHTFYSEILLKKENIRFGGGIKLIEGEGIKFLPQFGGNFGDFSINLEAEYSIPDFWYEFEHFNYKEIKKEKLSPFQNYKIGMEYLKENKSFSFNTQLWVKWLKRMYVWNDTDLNFLMEPVSIEDMFCPGIAVEFSKKLKESTNFFIDYRKNFYSKKVDYFPEGEGKAGFFLKSGKFEGKVWIEYKGKRRFSEDIFGSFTILNALLTYKIKKDILFGIRLHNLTGKEYNLFKGYPAEGRKISTFFVINF